MKKRARTKRIRLSCRYA